MCWVAVAVACVWFQVSAARPGAGAGVGLHGEKGGRSSKKAAPSWGRKQIIIDAINEMIEELDNITSNITDQVGQARRRPCVTCRVGEGRGSACALGAAARACRSACRRVWAEAGGKHLCWQAGGVGVLAGCRGPLQRALAFRSPPASKRALQCLVVVEAHQRGCCNLAWRAGRGALALERGDPHAGPQPYGVRLFDRGGQEARVPGARLLLLRLTSRPFSLALTPPAALLRTAKGLREARRGGPGDALPSPRHRAGALPRWC